MVAGLHFVLGSVMGAEVGEVHCGDGEEAVHEEGVGGG